MGAIGRVRMKHTKPNRLNCGGVFSFAPLLLAVCVGLGGCVVGPKYHTPSAPTPAAYKESPAPGADTGDWKVASPQDAMLRGKWWEVFGDPELNAMEDQLNIDNQNIKVSFENFMVARALVREARAQYFPTVTIGTAYTRSRNSATVGGGANSSGSGSSGVSGSGSTTTNTSGAFSLFSLP